MLEELAVLIEVLDGVSVVGARAIHELVEVVRQALLGCLPARSAVVTNMELAGRHQSKFFLPLYVEGPSS